MKSYQRKVPEDSILPDLQKSPNQRTCQLLFAKFILGEEKTVKTEIFIIDATLLSFNIDFKMLCVDRKRAHVTIAKTSQQKLLWGLSR